MQSSEEKLVSISVHVDENHLVKHIQSVVNRSLQFVRQEVTEIKASVHKVSDEVVELKKEMLHVQEIKLRKLATTLVDVRSAVCDSRAGWKAYHKAVEGRRLMDDEAEAAGLYDHHNLFNHLGDSADKESGVGADDGVDLDSERIKSLELQCAKLREQLRHLVEESTPKMVQDIHGRIADQASESKSLLGFLGLEVQPSHNGILHTADSIANSAYMREMSSSVEQCSRRVNLFEAELQSKCDRADIEALGFAVTDLRGMCDSTQKAVDVARQESIERTQQASRELKTELNGKVGWPDLEQWKRSVNEALLRTKDTLVKTQQSMNDLQLDGDHVRRNVDDINVKLAELIVSVPSAPPTTQEKYTHPQDAAVVSPVNDFSSLLNGVDSTMKRRIQEATQAAYYSYAEVNPPADVGVRVENIGKVSGEAAKTSGMVVQPQKRPRSALLIRR